MRRLNKILSLAAFIVSTCTLSLGASAHAAGNVAPEISIRRCTKAARGMPSKQKVAIQNAFANSLDLEAETAAYVGVSFEKLAMIATARISTHDVSSSHIETFVSTADFIEGDSQHVMRLARKEDLLERKIAIQRATEAAAADQALSYLLARSQPRDLSSTQIAILRAILVYLVRSSPKSAAFLSPTSAQIESAWEKINFPTDKPKWEQISHWLRVRLMPEQKDFHKNLTRLFAKLPIKGGAVLALRRNSFVQNTRRSNGTLLIQSLSPYDLTGIEPLGDAEFAFLKSIADDAQK